MIQAPALNEITVQDLGTSDYTTTLKAMQCYTAQRTASTPDALWLTQHPAVYTLGLNRKNARIPTNNIPLVKVDRGGKITYHGLGQVVIYTLIDLPRRGLNVRELVTILEQTIVDFLASYHIKAIAKRDAPGVYVNNQKIASLGLRLKNQCCYHGLSLNVNMDLSPFSAIDPCGYANLEMTQTHDLGIELTPQEIGNTLIHALKETLETWIVK